MSLVSVIIPVYKVEMHLARCIDSVLAQTYKNIEVILVDDGSPDNSGKICDEYGEKDTRIKVIHKENGGVSSARNVGIEMASGEYIAFVDSDDYVNETYVSDLVEAILQNGAEFSVCSFYIKNGQQETPQLISKERFVFDKISGSECEVLLSPVMQGPWNKLFLKSIIVDNNILFDSKIKYAEDAIFVYKYMQFVNNISVVSTPIYYYDTHSDGASRKFYPDMHFFLKQRFNEQESLIKTKFNISNDEKKYLLFKMALINCNALFDHYFKQSSACKTIQIYKGIYNDYISYLIDFTDEGQLLSSLFLGSKRLKSLFFSGEISKFYCLFYLKRALNKISRVLKG